MNTISTKYEHVLNLLEDLVKQNHPIPTNLIVCSSKSYFVAQILSALEDGRSNLKSSSAQQDEQNEELADTRPMDKDTKHFLLIPSLYLLAASQFVRLTFLPTIPLLRGYLSAYTSKLPPINGSPPRIVILDVLSLHHGSSEFTLQGLSQTFSTIASAGHRTNSCVCLVECQDIHDPHNVGHGSDLWQAEVPLLSGSIKIGEGGVRWGRRTVNVQKICMRWFTREEEAGVNSSTRQPQEEQMLI